MEIKKTKKVSDRTPWIDTSKLSDEEIGKILTERMVYAQCKISGKESFLLTSITGKSVSESLSMAVKHYIECKKV